MGLNSFLDFVLFYVQHLSAARRLDPLKSESELYTHKWRYCRGKMVLQERNQTMDTSSTSSDQHVPASKEVTQQEAARTETLSKPPLTQNEEPIWAHGFQLFNIMAALALVCFLMLLDSTIVVAAIPRITDDFNSLNDIGWYGAAYQLGSAVFQPLTGNFYMKFKPKVRGSSTLLPSPGAHQLLVTVD